MNVKSRNKKIHASSASKIILILFLLFLLVLDISGRIDVVNFRDPISIPAFLFVLAVAYFFINLGVKIGEKRKGENAGSWIGGFVGLSIFITICVMLFILMLKMSR